VEARTVIDKFEDDHAHTSKNYDDKVDVNEIEGLETPPKRLDLVVETIVSCEYGEKPIIYCIHIWRFCIDIRVIKINDFLKC